MKNTKKFKKEMPFGAIPVHINTCRDETHFWHWSSDLKGWCRGKKIPEKLNRMYKTPPPTKSVYK